MKMSRLLDFKDRIETEMDKEAHLILIFERALSEKRELSNPELFKQTIKALRDLQKFRSPSDTGDESGSSTSLK